jgi:hypothetical protein
VIYRHPTSNQSVKGMGCSRQQTYAIWSDARFRRTVLNMRVAILLLTTSLITSAAGQELPCISSFRRLQWDKQDRLITPVAPAAIRHHLPRDANLQFVIPLSSSDTLTIYGSGDSYDPDTRLLVTDSNRVLAHLAVKDLFGAKDSFHDPEWARSLRTFGTAHLCADGHNMTYVVLQTGNQGGYFAVLAKDNDGFHLLPIKAVQQGRIVLDIDDPAEIDVWSVADENSTDCTGCPKHYVVERMQFDGKSFKVIAKKKTEKKYESFQDEPLVLSRKR